MAVRLPSDLIVDVMRAAAPDQVRAAAAKLKSRAGAPEPGTMFSDALNALQGPAAAKTSASQSGDAYGQFESFMLRTAVEDMMPEGDTTSFGGGFAGGVWRSMAAEQVASIFTERGGLGIAEMLRARAGGGEQTAAVGHWPYCSAPAISAYEPPSFT